MRTLRFVDTHTGRLVRLEWKGDHWLFRYNGNRFAPQPIANIAAHLRADGFIRDRKRK